MCEIEVCVRERVKFVYDLYIWKSDMSNLKLFENSSKKRFNGEIEMLKIA